LTEALPAAGAGMLAFFRIIGWSLLGALIAGTVAFAGFLIFNRNEILGPKDADEIQAWARFSAIMGSLGIALTGFVVGAIYGIVRGRREI
jgi:hypothetical protein